MLFLRLLISFNWYVSQDWQEGGRSDVYLWGNGRYGQLAGTGTNLTVPTLAPCLSQTQQVAQHCESGRIRPDHDFLLILCLSAVCGVLS